MKCLSYPDTISAYYIAFITSNAHYHNISGKIMNTNNKQDRKKYNQPRLLKLGNMAQVTKKSGGFADANRTDKMVQTNG